MTFVLFGEPDRRLVARPRPTDRLAPSASAPRNVRRERRAFALQPGARLLTIVARCNLARPDRGDDRGRGARTPHGTRSRRRHAGVDHDRVPPHPCRRAARDPRRQALPYPYPRPRGLPRVPEHSEEATHGPPPDRTRHRHQRRDRRRGHAPGDPPRLDMFAQVALRPRDDARRRGRRRRRGHRSGRAPARRGRPEEGRRCASASRARASSSARSRCR